MDRDDLPFLSASDLSRLIQKKEVSPVEAVEAYLDRIERLDDKLNSYITVDRDRVLESARQAQGTIAQGGYLGPMHELPVAVKDQICTGGIRTTAGTTMLADYVPQDDATVIANLKIAGALLGKQNMHGFGMGDPSSHPYGTHHNPWDLERSPGGTSSGSGAGTASPSKLK